MAHYLVVTGDDPTMAEHVEAKNLQRAIEKLGLEPGEKATVYRIASAPRVVRVREETVRKVEIE